MKTQRALLVLIGAMTFSLLTGCGSQSATEHSEHAGHEQAPPAYKDGTYTATSSPDDKGAVGEVNLTVRQGKIVQADYRGIQKDGKVKDAEYGKTNGKIENEDFYSKAQKAVKGAATYGPKLVEAQDLAKVDAVSGATVSYQQFIESGHKALDQAQAK